MIPAHGFCRAVLVCALVSCTFGRLAVASREVGQKLRHTQSIGPDELRRAALWGGAISAPAILPIASISDARALNASETGQAPLLERRLDSNSVPLIGSLLAVLALLALWFNERRGVRLETVVALATSQVRSVDGGVCEEANRGALVHLRGEQMRAAELLKDRQFNVTFTEDCVRLRTVVQIYQHIEHARTPEEMSRKRGGDLTDAYRYADAYRYTQAWSSAWHVSSNYKDLRYNHNTKPGNLQPGIFTQNCSRVEYGRGFVFSQCLVDQCVDFCPADGRLDDEVALGAAWTFATEPPSFKRGTDHYFYWRETDGTWQGDGEPQVGDVRVLFEYVPNGPATVMAVQCGGKACATRDTFMPYTSATGRCACCCARRAAPEKPVEESPASPLRYRRSGRGSAAETSSADCLPQDSASVCHLFRRDLSARGCLAEIAKTGPAASGWLRATAFAVLVLGIRLAIPSFLLAVAAFLPTTCAPRAAALVIFVPVFVSGLAISIAAIAVGLIFIFAHPACYPLRLLLYSFLLGAVVAFNSLLAIACPED